jgi:hypothetical protein
VAVDTVIATVTVQVVCRGQGFVTVQVVGTV